MGVDIVPDAPDDTMATGGAKADIERLQADLARHDAAMRMTRDRAKQELEAQWAADRQAVSILLFRTFAISLVVLFWLSIYVILTRTDPVQVHLASVMMEMILASVIAGFLGYLLAKPFDHRQ